MRTFSLVLANQIISMNKLIEKLKKNNPKFSIELNNDNPRDWSDVWVMNKK